MRLGYLRQQLATYGGRLSGQAAGHLGDGVLGWLTGLLAHFCGAANLSYILAKEFQLKERQ